MHKIENECCGCATPAYPCLGNSCPQRNVKRFYCDKCGEEHKLYEFEGAELCMDCIQEILEDRVIEGSD